MLLLHSLSDLKTVRVVVLQSSQVLTTFLQDQLEEDMKRDQKVQSQQLSREEAEKDAEEWNEVRRMPQSETIRWLGWMSPLGPIAEI